MHFKGASLYLCTLQGYHWPTNSIKGMKAYEIYMINIFFLSILHGIPQTNTYNQPTVYGSKDLYQAKPFEGALLDMCTL